jgi:WD40 repeat protein/Ran GTPase-activating protein (RanGAP) involved in mRNA processing and transport
MKLSQQEWQRILQDIWENKVSELDLAGMELTSVEAKQLAQALFNNISLTELILLNPGGHFFIGDEGARALAEALKTNKTLKVLRLGSNRIGSAGAIALAKMLEANNSIELLDLHWNDIGDAGAKALAQVLRSHPKLTTLEVEHNGIGKDGGAALIEAWRHSQRLMYFGLWKNPIGSDENASLLAAGLKNNRTLTTLMIGGCDFGKEGLITLFESLKTNNVLRILNIYAHPAMGANPEVMEALADMLAVNKALVDLNIANSGINADGMKGLARGLKENNSLLTLYVYANKFGSKGATELSHYLKENISLAVLWIQECELGDEGAREIAEAVKQNNSLVNLAIMDNGLTVVGMDELKNAMHTNTSLMYLYLKNTDLEPAWPDDSNQITGLLKQAINVFVQRNRSPYNQLIAAIEVDNADEIQRLVASSNSISRMLGVYIRPQGTPLMIAIQNKKLNAIRALQLFEASSYYLTYYTTPFSIFNLNKELEKLCASNLKEINFNKLKSHQKIWFTGSPLPYVSTQLNTLVVLQESGLLAGGFADGTIKLWDSTTGEYLGNRGMLVGHGTAVSCLTALKGNRLASADADGFIKIWDLSSMTCISPPIRGYSKAIWSLIAIETPNEYLLVSGKGNECAGEANIKFWDLESYKKVGEVAAAHVSSYICSLVMLPNGLLAAAGGTLGGAGSILLCDVNTKTIVGQMGHDGWEWVDSLALVYDKVNPELWYLASTGRTSANIRLWDVRNDGKSQLISEASISGINYIRTLADGRLVSVSRQGHLGLDENCAINVWNIDHSTLSPQLTSVDNIVMTERCSPQGAPCITALESLPDNRLAIATSVGEPMLKFWQLKHRELVYKDIATFIEQLSLCRNVLERLSLENIQLSDKGYEHLFSFYQNSKTLQCLGLNSEQQLRLKTTLMRCKEIKLPLISPSPVTSTPTPTPNPKLSTPISIPAIQITQWPADIVYALLAEHVYQKPIQHYERVVIKRDGGFNNIKLLENEWRVDSTYEDRNTGYFSAIYLNKNTKHAVLVHRGTDDLTGNDFIFTKRDIRSDFDLIKGDIPAQVSNFFAATLKAAELAQQGYHLSITGHSLGAIATVYSALFLLDNCDYNQFRAVLFDPPGFKASLSHYSKTVQKSFVEANIRIYFGPPNLINTLNQHVDEIQKYRIYPKLARNCHHWPMSLLPIEHCRAISGHYIRALVDQFDMTTGMPRKIHTVQSWPDVDPKIGNNTVILFMKSTVDLATNINVFYTTVGMAALAGLFSFQQLPRDLKKIVNYIVFINTAIITSIQAIHYFFPMVGWLLEYSLGGVDSTKLDMFLKHASASDDLELNLDYCIPSQEIFNTGSYLVEKYNSRNISITSDLKPVVDFISQLCIDVSLQSKFSNLCGVYSEASKTSGFIELPMEPGDLRTFAQLTHNEIIQYLETSHKISHEQPLLIDKWLDVSKQLSSRPICKRKVTSSATKLTPFSFYQRIYQLLVLAGSISYRRPALVGIGSERKSEQLTSVMGLTEEVLWEPLKEMFAWLSMWQRGKLNTSELVSQQTSSELMLHPHAPHQSLRDLGISWLYATDFEVDNRTGAPIFTVYALREKERIGHMKLWGRPDFCVSRSGLHNIVELGGVLQGQQDRIDPTQAQEHCTSLPPMGLGGRLGQAAIQGAVLGSCNVLIQAGAQRGQISQKTANVLSLVMYGTVLYALNFHRHYNAHWEVAEEDEPIAYTAAVEAAIDTAQVMAVHALSVGCEKASRYCENTGRRWSAGFFKCAEKVVSASRYVLPLVGAWQENSWASSGRYLGEAAAQIGTGVGVQMATEEVGRQIFSPWP